MVAPWPTGGAVEECQPSATKWRYLGHPGKCTPGKMHLRVAWKAWSQPMRAEARNNGLTSAANGCCSCCKRARLLPEADWGAPLTSIVGQWWVCGHGEL